MLIAQPFGQQQGVQPGAQSTDPTGAMAEVAVGSGVTYFTGTRMCSPEFEERSLVEKVWVDRLHLTCEVVTTDSRFDGTEEVGAIYYVPMPHGAEPGPWTAEGVLTGEEGSWLGTGEGVLDIKGDSPLTARDSFHYGAVTYRGEGAYEGLVAHYYFAGDPDVLSLTGWITSGE